jgi:hypothetical protein
MHAQILSVTCTYLYRSGMRLMRIPALKMPKTKHGALETVPGTTGESVQAELWCGES